MFKMDNTNMSHFINHVSNRQDIKSKILLLTNSAVGLSIILFFASFLQRNNLKTLEIIVLILGILFVLINLGFLLFFGAHKREEIPSSVNNKSLDLNQNERDQVIKGIAHDFNNILTTLTGILSISLIDIQENPDYNIFQNLQENLDIALKATQRATGLTEQLLSFGKGGQPIKKNASLEEIVKDSTKFILAGSSVAANFEIPFNIPPLDVDPNQFSQVIQNLVLNAKQAMNNRGRISVKMELFKNQENFYGKYQKERLIWANNQHQKRLKLKFPMVCVSIQDNGPGIPPEVQNKLFHFNVTTKNRGNGLGLVSCYHIIRKHDGHIAFHTQYGKGTTFYITLPLNNKSDFSQRSILKKTEMQQSISDLTKLN